MEKPKWEFKFFNYTIWLTQGNLLVILYQKSNVYKWRQYQF